MWILNWLPNFVIHLMVIIGLLGIIMSWAFTFMPFVSAYKLPIQIISIIVLVIGIWIEGANSDNADWLLKVKELEVKVAQAETKSAELNALLTQTILEKNNIIKDKQNETDKAITKYVNDECRLSNAAVSLFNSSSQGELPDSTIGTISGTSQVKISELLITVSDNNATYYEIATKLAGWQEWYNKNKEIFDGIQ